MTYLALGLRYFKKFISRNYFAVPNRISVTACFFRFLCRPASTSFLRRANTARRFNPNLNTTFSSPVTLRKQQQQQHHYQQQQQPGGAANWSPWSVEPQDQLRQFAINSAAIEGGSTTAVAAPQRKSPQIYRVKNEDLRRDFRQ